jgi:hypothetical protein
LAFWFLSCPAARGYFAGQFLQTGQWSY